MKMFALLEARSSSKLDKGGTITIAATQARPQRDRPGFGCPHCGEGLDLEDRRTLIRGPLKCCGYWPTALEVARWLRASRLLPC